MSSVETWVSVYWGWGGGVSWRVLAWGREVRGGFEGRGVGWGMRKGWGGRGIRFGWRSRGWVWDRFVWRRKGDSWWVVDAWERESKRIVLCGLLGLYG